MSWSSLDRSAVERALRDNEQLRRELQREVSASATFDAIDTNKDGVIERHEFSEYINNNLATPAPPAAYKSFFAKAYADRTGVDPNPTSSAQIHASVSSGGNLPVEEKVHNFSAPHHLPQQQLVSRNSTHTLILLAVQLWSAVKTPSQKEEAAASGYGVLTASVISVCCRGALNELSLIEQALEQNEHLRGRLKALTLT